MRIAHGPKGERRKPRVIQLEQWRALTALILCLGVPLVAPRSAVRNEGTGRHV